MPRRLGGMILALRLNAVARRELRWAAKQEGVPLSTYIRERAMADAQRKREASKAAREEALLAQRLAGEDAGVAA